MLKSIRMHNWKNNHGFTLVELLVVISIIALLLAVLMPALSAARKTAQRVVCSTNIKGLGDGTLLFAADHDDWLPIEDGKTLGSLKAQYGCADCLALGSRFPQRNYWFVDIAPYVGLEKDPYIQHTGGMKNSWLTAEQAGINAPSLLVCHSKKKSIYGVHPLAYGWNWYGLGESCKSYFSPSPSRILNYWGPWKIVQIRSPYITGIIGENALGQDPVLERGVSRSYWGGEVAASDASGTGGFYDYGSRHKGGSSYYAVDGHIEFRTLQEYINDYKYYRYDENGKKVGGGIIFPSPRRWKIDY